MSIKEIMINVGKCWEAIQMSIENVFRKNTDECQKENWLTYTAVKMVNTDKCQKEVGSIRMSAQLGFEDKVFYVMMITMCRMPVIGLCGMPSKVGLQEWANKDQALGDAKKIGLQLFLLGRGFMVCQMNDMYEQK